MSSSYSDHQDHGLCKKSSLHRRNNSGELNVFEAANYFSASNVSHDQQSVSSHKANKDNFATKSCKESDQAWKPKGARMSLDMPGRTTSKLKVPELRQSGYKVHDQVVKEKMVKSKQPSSPGGRLASFLNSLFNHSASKKKKTPRQDDPRLRTRRSSISHVDSRSMYSSASTTATGFRTPPPPVYKTFFDDSKSLQDHKRTSPGIESRAKSSMGLDLNPKISNGSLSAFDKTDTNSTNGLGEKEKVEFVFKKVDKSVKELEFNQVDINKVNIFEFKKHVKEGEEEDGGDQSDTSSDLFELKNYELGEFPSELRVYETTNVDQIENSAKLETRDSANGS